MNTLHRRAFLQQSAAATIGFRAMASLEAKDAPADLPVVDTHIHVWDLKKFKLPWLKEGTELAKDFLIADYNKATEGSNVVKGIYMEVDVDASQKQAEADWIRGVCKEGKSIFVGAVVGGLPATEEFRKYAMQFKGDPYVKGIRQVLHNTDTPPGFGLEKTFLANIQLLGELGLTFDLCLRGKDLQDGVKIASKCPGTRFVLDHCGNPNVQAKDQTAWKKDIEAIAKMPNVICKISGILATAKKGEWTAEQLAPIVNHCIDSFGIDRVIFASDWPVCTRGGTFKQWLDAIKTITQTRKADERKKLFHDNAVKFYGLKA